MFNIENNRRIYLRDDIKIDRDILANIKRYDLINSLTDADGVEFNIYLASMEEWLKQKWQCNNLSDFYKKIACRFNSSFDEIRTAGEYELCFLICFLEHLKASGHYAYFDLYSEAVLHIDGNIIDNEIELMS